MNTLNPEFCELKAAEAAATYHVNKALAAYRRGTQMERDKNFDGAAPYFDKYAKHIAIADAVRARIGG